MIDRIINSGGFYHVSKHPTDAHIIVSDGTA